MTLQVDVTLHVGDTARAIAFAAPQGRFVVIVGPNGSGKTTLLRALVGLQAPASGVIRMDDALWSRDDEVVVPAPARRFGWLPQRPSLLRSATVEDNLALAARGRGLTSQQARDAVCTQVERLDLSPLLTRRVHQLSGGEIARVCLARTLAASPSRLALDEPLGSVDPSAQAELVQHLRASVAGLEGPHLVVTHQPDAFAAVDPLVVDLSGLDAPPQVNHSPT